MVMMANQYRCCILAIFLLFCISFIPFGVAFGGINGVQRNSKLRNTKLESIPLRDDSDYNRDLNSDATDPHNVTNYDTYDDADDADEYSQPQLRMKSRKNGGIIVEQARSAPPQIIQRPKQRTDAEIVALLKPSQTADADIEAPSTIEMCPNECSCLSDSMSCTSLRSKHLPKVPQYMQKVYLSQNDLTAEQCEDNIKNLQILSKLKLNGNKLQRMPVFRNLNSLRTLDLADNEIREITMVALRALQNLEVLNLSRNLIIQIGPGTFPKVNVLQKLNLNNNRIEHLDRRAFETLVRMTDLKINNNRIGQLPTGLFTKLKKLKKLSLNGNELRKNLQYATFSNLTALTTLKLRNNFIDELITGLFHGLDNLNALELANNHLSEIQKGGLLNITALTKLNLSNNSIHTIGKNCWEFTQKIVDLDLSQNRLTEINAGTFDMLAKLKELNLSENRISTIATGAMNATYNLETLDLSHNQISSTIEDSFGPFASLTKLESFYLNDNNIKTINRNAFLGLSSLKSLNLRSNNITTIQDGAFDLKTTPKLRQLLMNSTDLICDCKLFSFYLWIKDSAALRKKQNGKNDWFDVRCAYPHVLHGERLMQLHNDNFTCHDTPKPQMIDEPKSTILAIRGSNITIECTAFVTVGSDITFSWRHNNSDVNNTLVETKTRIKDESRLRVKERVIERRREINRVPLRISYSAPKVPLADSSVSKMKDDSDDNDYENDESENDENEYEVETEALDGDQVDEIFATVEDIEASIPLNSSIATTRLHLTNVDHTHAGRYQCIASNDFGKAYSQKFKVTVASFPVFTKQPTNITVKASQTVRLDYAVSGDPKPQIYWQFNFGKVFPAALEKRMRIVDNDEAFIIDNVKPSDRGVYTCTAENVAGIITFNVTVDIVEPFTYIKPMEHKDVIIGNYTVLECSNSTTSRSKVRWFKNSKSISSTKGRYLLRNNSQLLIIVEITEDDAGLYTCEFENSLGIEKTSIQLIVRPDSQSINQMDKYTHNGITTIIIITVVVCAIGTSIIWIVIIYQTKNDTGCNGGGMDDDKNGHAAENCLTKEHGVLGSVQISMIPKGDTMSNLPVQSMRTATIGRGNGVLRSHSGSSCDHSSIGVSDDILRRYKDECSMNNTLLGKQIPNGTDTEDDDDNDHEALLTYSDRYPTSVKCSDNDSFVVRMQDGVDGVSSQHETSSGNTTTAECDDDVDIDDGQQYSTKTKTSNSLSSSCHSIPPLPLNSSHEFDLNRSQNNFGSLSRHSASKPFVTKPNKPVIQPVPIGKTKPTIQTNKLNELMSTFK